MENENIENNILENTESPMEDPTNSPVLPEDVLPNEETMEEIQAPTQDVLENEAGNDSTGKTVTVVGSGNETYVEMNNGAEEFYDSVSDNNFDYEEIYDTSTTHTYVTNVYEVVEEPSVPLWESDISELNTTDTLLFLILLLLLVQFIHNIFKGSHWFKG